MSDEIIEKRKENFARIFKNNLGLKILCIVLLAIVILLTINARTSNVENLKDITTNSYTLGPDLDPFLFLRWAKYIVTNGELMPHDSLRYVPIGYDTVHEARFTAYGIAYLYKFWHFFNKNISVTYAAVIYPVIFFALATLIFFLLVRRLFIHEKHPELIALIAAAFFAFIPVLLPRTVAGIPEKESGGLFFMMLSFYFFTLALQSKNIKQSFIYGILSGAATFLLGFTWGGESFVWLVIPLAVFIYFFLNNLEKKDVIAYSAWLISYMLFFSIPGIRYGNALTLVFSSVRALAFFTFFLLLIGIFFRKEKGIKIKKFMRMEKIPTAIFSFIVTLLIVVIVLAIFKPAMIVGMVNEVKVNLLHPIGTDRVTLTVAENNQPYFSAWRDSFYSPFFLFKNKFPASFFWLFFFASVLLWYGAVKDFKKTDKYILTFAYLIFLISLIFSRYSPNSNMDGVSSLSQFVYFLGFAIFVLTFGAIYFYSYKNKDIENFKKIKKEIILILVMFMWASISARGAIRLFFLLAPIVAILAGFVGVKAYEYAKENKEAYRILWIAITVIVVLILLNAFFVFYNVTKNSAQSSRPGVYQYQWQKAMFWVRENTDKNAVFGHWWDYGYWVQSIGERATVLDGGNSYPYWNYLMGRHVLTGQNEEEALEFLYTRNATHYLIDSTDIGKFPAYSSIGSDLNYDRYSMIPTIGIDQQQSFETRNETNLVYTLRALFDSDTLWYDAETKQQYLFQKSDSNSFIFAIVVPQSKDSMEIKQPYMMVVSKGRQLKVPMCYLYISSEQKTYKFEDSPCIKSSLYILPVVRESGGSVNVNNLGAAIYLSEKNFRTLMVQIYLLDNYKDFSHFKLVHNEPDLIVSQLRANGMNVPDIIEFNGLRGPIKIWQISYPSDIKANPEYLLKNYPDPRLTIPL